MRLSVGLNVNVFLFCFFLPLLDSFISVIEIQGCSADLLSAHGMRVCRWAKTTWTYYDANGFSFHFHPGCNHLSLTHSSSMFITHTAKKKKIPGRFLPQQGLIHILYIICKLLGQSCFDKALEVAGSKLAVCLTLTVERIQTSSPPRKL